MRRTSVIIALVVGVYLWQTATLPAQTELIVPFMKFFVFPLGGVAFVALVYFVVVGTSNAVNLTDGLDGLAIMPTVMVSGALAIFAYVAGNAVFAKYLGIPYIPGAGELAVFCGSIGWALVWQSWPALLAGLALAPLFDGKARLEERWLRQQFPEYATYARRVRRFVPWIY